MEFNPKQYDLNPDIIQCMWCKECWRIPLQKSTCRTVEGYLKAICRSCICSENKKGGGIMGSIASGVIRGFMCAHCGTCFDGEHGYPVLCEDCYDSETVEESAGLSKAYLKEL